MVQPAGGTFIQVPQDSIGKQVATIVDSNSHHHQAIVEEAAAFMNNLQQDVVDTASQMFGQNELRRGLLIVNRGPNVVYVGNNSGVDTLVGWPLEPPPPGKVNGSVISIPTASEVWVICDTGLTSSAVGLEITD